MPWRCCCLSQALPMTLGMISDPGEVVFTNQTSREVGYNGNTYEKCIYSYCKLVFFWLSSGNYKHFLCMSSGKWSKFGWVWGSVCTVIAYVAWEPYIPRTGNWSNLEIVSEISWKRAASNMKSSQSPAVLILFMFNVNPRWQTLAGRIRRYPPK